MVLSISLFALISALLVIAAAVLVVLQSVLALGAGAVIAIYALLAASCVAMGVADFKANVASQAFRLSDALYMRVVSYLCAAGFVVDTVVYILRIYDCLSGKSDSAAAIPLFALSALFALLSALVMILVAISFGSSKYNFKRLTLMAFSPLIWAVLQVSNMMLGYVNASSPADFLKAAAVAAALAFFYRFAYEVAKDGTASRLTLFFADLLSVCGILYFVSRVALVIADGKNLFDYDNVFAVVILLIAVFSITLKVRIVKYVQ
ncbi:MAG: hypothetical protein IJR60_08415 [Eubacterium sp.]|nr:hypothetical protein [Eubacterium sp.]